MAKRIEIEVTGEHLRFPMDLDLVILRHAYQRPRRWRLFARIRWAYEHDQLVALRELRDSIRKHPSADPWTVPAAADQRYITEGAISGEAEVVINDELIRRPFFYWYPWAAGGSV